MRVLQICPKPPVPSVDGGCIAMHAITKGLLKSGISVKVFCASTPKHPFLPALIDSDYLKQTGFEHIAVNTGITAAGALWALISGKSYNVSRFYSRGFNNRLIDILKKNTFDIIHLETLFVTPYLNTIRKYSKAPVVLRALNVEHEIWSRLSSNEPNPVKRFYLKALAKKLRKYEEETLKKVDGIAAITGKDAANFKEVSDVPVISVPLGIDMAPAADKKIIPAANTVFHLGAMDWLPNQEGVQWFLDEAWPLILQSNPKARCYLAGRNMPRKLLKQKHHHVFIEGEIKDADDFILSKNVMVVPLLSGSGIRVKILEAMALGKPIVTTTVGASGIEGENGKHFLIADTPEAFAEAVNKCLADAAYSKALADNSRQLALYKYELSNVTASLTGFYKKLLKE